MRLTFALITTLGAAFAAPLVAEVPSMEGLVSVIAKSDALGVATDQTQIEAAMAVCLAVGANRQMAEMVFAEHGWTRTAEGNDDFVVLAPASGPQGLEVYLDAQEGPINCSVSAPNLGGEAAHGLVKGLLGAADPAFNTVTEGDDSISCTKYDFGLPTFLNGRVYVSVLDYSGEEPSCLPSATESLTTFAFVEH